MVEGAERKIYVNNAAMFTNLCLVDEKSVIRKLGRARFWHRVTFPATRLFANLTANLNVSPGAER
jgi:hypothetical protein